MTKYKPTNQLRFINRKEYDGKTMSVQLKKVLQQLWEETLVKNDNAVVEFYPGKSEWRDVELVNESEAGE